MKLQNLTINDIFIITELQVPETVINDITFPALDLKNLKVKVIDDYKGNKLCLFDKALFYSKINGEDCEWKNSALCKYLSTVFTKSLENIFKCEVEINLLTKYEVFGDGEQKSNFSVYPKKYKLEKDIFAFNYDTSNSSWYWLSTKTSLSPSHFCGVTHNGNSYYDSCYSALGVRPAFNLLICNQDRFSGSSIDIAKQNKILEIQKAGIDGFYHANEITEYELDLFVDFFVVEIKGQKFIFDYENFRNPENIEKLKTITKSQCKFIKVENIEKWHNMMENPSDLPIDKRSILVKWNEDDYRVVRWLASEKVFYDEVTDDKFCDEYYPPIAWKDI